MTQFDFYKFSFVNNLNGWLTANFGSRKFLKQHDFGSVTGIALARFLMEVIQIHNIFFSSLNTGYAGGAWIMCIKTTNGGYNWLYIKVGMGPAYAIYIY